MFLRVDIIISQINPPAALTCVLDEIHFEWFKKSNIKEFNHHDDSISNLDNAYFFIFEPLKRNLVLLNIIQKWSFLKTGKKIHFQKKITI